MAAHELVVFDVIGTKFCLKKNLFDEHKTSLFYRLLHEKYLLPNCIIKMNDDEFFVQRSPDLVKIVILYCINGKLHMPSNTCTDEILDEFDFWKINYEKSCINCASHIHESRLRSASEDTTDDPIYSETCSCRTTLWTFMQHPHSSCVALVSGQ